MCGIVGGISQTDIVPIILDGLSKLEYRGYDSAGISVIDNAGNLIRERVISRVADLTKLCDNDRFNGSLIGVGHTRWATHGEVSCQNAHPHFSNGLISLVHNGIIENYVTLHNELTAKGYVFESQTDTEVIVHLIHSLYIQNNDLTFAVKRAIKRLQGAYAIGVICSDNPHQIVCARRGSPLVLGVGANEMFFASDIFAILSVTQKLVYLEDGDVAQINLNNYTICDIQDKLVKRKVSISDLSSNQTNLGQYKHYMQKEIFEQPKAIARTLQALGSSFDPHIFGNEALNVLSQIDRIQIVACGTSLNAGYVAKYWIEELSGINCLVDIASEYRYKKITPYAKTLLVNISQSGETADTIACVQYAHALGMPHTLSICNVDESSLVRLSKLHVLTHAGVEIGVASTKAFTTQLVVLLYLAYTLAKVRNKLSVSDEKLAITEIHKLPDLISKLLSIEACIKTVADNLKDKQNALFLGRNTLYPIAIEGALKLKEISYIHAEGYAFGELKHGALALIDSKMPSIVLMPSQILMNKTQSNVEEILARKGLVYLFTDVVTEIDEKCYTVIHMPYSKVSEYLLPILYIIPLQLLAYHAAIIKGTDVDKPRNLAKSVTVE